MSPDYIHYKFLLAESQDIFTGPLWDLDCEKSNCEKCPAYDVCRYLSINQLRHIRSNETNMNFLLLVNRKEFHKRSLQYYYDHFPEFLI